jgi:hypothetical protein
MKEEKGNARQSSDSSSSSPHFYRVIGLLNASRDEPPSIEIHLPNLTLILKIDKQCLINWTYDNERLLLYTVGKTEQMIEKKLRSSLDRNIGTDQSPLDFPRTSTLTIH